MKCRECGDTAVGDTALAHLSLCGRCAERLDEERRLTERLSAFAASCAGEQAPASVEEQVLAAFRLRHAVRRRRRLIAAVSIGSVAAGILWVTLPLRRVEPLTPRPVVTVVAAVDPPVKPVAKIAKVRSPLGRLARRQPPSRPEVELETDFFPVVQGDDWTPGDGANLMRVELPKSALGAFGLPVGQELAPERVQADVVLSDDGLLRAIRFVR